MAPATLAEAARWADSTRPADNRDLRFRWKFQDQHDATAAGRGRVRLALPDSVRFDAAGSLGIGRVAAFVAGDTAIWAEPEKDVQKLVPNYQLFWAMLGIVRVPAQADGVRRFADATLTAWQFSLGQDTVEYVREHGAVPRLIAEVRQGGERLARVETKFGPDGLPTSSRLIVVRPPSKLELTFYQNVTARPFAPDTWTRPAPPSR
ncbi:MAG TPA: hypothetical protein VGQ69_13445 [Gemmatimonadales bacterium]|jgi:hypothetical protein|nr:hypothetical protein [Gemmatimonadales bacterium]